MRKTVVATILLFAFIATPISAQQEIDLERAAKNNFLSDLTECISYYVIASVGIERLVDGVGDTRGTDASGLSAG